MYAGVPTARPVSVSCAPPAALTARAIPKSATTACPLWSRMFSGLMSRCTTPWRCAYAERVRHLARDLQRVVERELLLAA